MSRPSNTDAGLTASIHNQDPSAYGHYSGLRPRTFGALPDPYPIVEGVYDDPGCNVRRNERALEEEFLRMGLFEFRGGGSNQTIDTSVHTRYVEPKAS